MDQSHYAEKLLEHITRIEKEIKYLENPMNYLTASPGDVQNKRPERIQILNKELREYDIKIAQYIDKHNKEKSSVGLLDTEDKISLEWNGLIILNSDNQSIKIWSHVFWNFESLFKNLNIKESKKKTQLKWGLSLIYAIAIRGVKENQLESDLFESCMEFKKKWNKWDYQKTGKIKKHITKTDCESAEQILNCCGLSMKLNLSEDKKEISITK